MFAIKITRSAVSPQFDPEDCSVAEAIETIYPHELGCIARMYWQGFSIGLNGLMIAGIYNDIVKMLMFAKSEAHMFRGSFLDTGMTAVWDIERITDHLTISATWTTATNVIGPNGIKAETAALRALPALVVSTTAFVQAWECVLRLIKEDLIVAGYDNALKNFTYLDTF
jgi:hypothetical protein